MYILLSCVSCVICNQILIAAFGFFVFREAGKNRGLFADEVDAVASSFRSLLDAAAPGDGSSAQPSLRPLPLILRLLPPLNICYTIVHLVCACSATAAAFQWYACAARSFSMSFLFHCLYSTCMNFLAVSSMGILF